MGQEPKAIGLTILWRFRIVSAALLLPPLLRLTSLDGLARRLGRPARVKRPDALQQAEIGKAVDKLLDRLPPPWRKTCLTRSVVLYHLFRRSGVPVELCIGVRREQSEFAAHAWLTREDRPFLEPEIPSYDVIAKFPA